MLGQGRRQISLEKSHLHAKPFCISTGNLQSIGGLVDGVHRRRRKQFGERHRYSARAGTHVGNGQWAGLARRTQPLARLLDERLGVRAGDQHAGVDGEVESPELLLADEVGDRLTGLPPLDERSNPGQLLGLQGPVELNVELHARQTQHVRDQDLGVEPRRRNPALREPGGGPPNHVQQGPLRGDG